MAPPVAWATREEIGKSSREVASSMRLKKPHEIVVVIVFDESVHQRTGENGDKKTIGGFLTI